MASDGGADGAVTWSELHAALRDRYPYTEDTETGARFVLVMGEEETRVGLVAGPMAEAAEDAVEVMADLGPSTHIDPWGSLDLNAALTYGALAVRDGVLYLRAAVLLRGGSIGWFLDRVHRVAAEAAVVKRRMNMATPSGEEFSHYVE